jgi:NADH-quinone oxidoreductase subunit J
MLTFAILAAVMILGAIGVVTLRQPVHAALSLVGTMLTLAVVYVTLHAHFLAAIQVIVYAGAVMVLFLFVIMLLNVEGEGESQQRVTWARPVAYLVGVLAAGVLAATALLNPREALDVATVTAALRGGEAEAIGEALFTDYILAFQLVGVLLLTSIVGAVALVQRKIERRPPAAVAERKEPKELERV